MGFSLEVGALANVQATSPRSHLIKSSAPALKGLGAILRRVAYASPMNHKRRRPKSRRAGCLLCKPNKLGRGLEYKLGHRGFGKIKAQLHADSDLKSE